MGKWQKHKKYSDSSRSGEDPEYENDEESEKNENSDD